MNNKIFVSAYVHTVGDKGIAYRLGVVAVNKIPGALCGFKLLRADDLVSEYDFGIKKRYRHRNDTVPEKMREPLKQRIVYIFIVFADRLCGYLCGRKLVIKLIGVIDNFSAFQNKTSLPSFYHLILKH